MKTAYFIVSLSCALTYVGLILLMPIQEASIKRQLQEGKETSVPNCVAVKYVPKKQP